MKDFKIKLTDIPLGSWDTYGNWYPNLNLNMSVAQQRRHNMVGGHFKVEPVDLHCCLFVDEPETLFKKIRRLIID